MTYVVYELPSTTPVFSTNAKTAALRFVRWRCSTMVMGVDAGMIAGFAFFLYGARVSVQQPPPMDVGEMWLARARHVHALIELPNGPRIRRRLVEMRRKAT